MSTVDPYKPPQNRLASETTQAYADINIFSSAGRIGRLRLIAYSFGITLLLYLAIAVFAGLASLFPEQLAPVIIGIVLVTGFSLVVFISVILMIQRLHDLDNSGWFSLLMLVPIVGSFFVLYLWFWPGTQGINRFGNPPPPNKMAALIVIILAAIVFIGIIAAIAIPAYNDYLLRAQSAGMQSP